MRRKPNTLKVLRVLEGISPKLLKVVIAIERRPLDQRKQKRKKRLKRKQVMLNSHERKRERSKQRKAGLRFFKNMAALRAKLRWARLTDNRNKKLHDYF
jgi:hypothetical protein